MADNFGLKIGVEGEKEFKKALAEINQTFKVLGSEMNLVASQFDKQDKSVEALSARNRVLNQEIDTQRQKISTLQQALENATNSFGENDRRTKQWQTQLNNAQATLNEMERELADNNRALEEAGNAMDDAGDQADDFGDSLVESADKADDAGGRFEKLGSIAKTIGAVVAAAVVAIGAAAISAGVGLVQLGDEYNQAVNQISASTGATGAELEALGETARKVYTNNFGDSLEDVAEGLSVVRRTTVLMDDDLQKATESGFALRDTFGYDLQESARAASALMKNFGVTAEEAYNIIAVGAQNGADQNGDLLDTLNEYSAQYAALGLSADEFVSGLISGAEAGVFSIDKVGDAVKEFNLRVKDGSDTTTQAFQALGMDADAMAARFAAGGDTARQAFFEVVNALDDMDDPIAKNTAAVNLFGTQFEDLQANVLPVLASMEDGAGRTYDALSQINQIKYDNLDSAIEGTKRSIQGVFLPLAREMSAGITDVFSTLGNEINAANGNFEQIGLAIGSAIEGVLNIILEKMPVFLELGMNIVTSIGSAIMTNLPLLIESATNIILTLLNGLVAALPLLTEGALQLVLTLVQGILMSLPQIMEAAVQMIATLATGLAQAAPTLIPSIVQAVMLIAQTLIENLPLLLDAALQLITGLAQGLLDAIPVLIAALPEIITAIVTFLLDSIPQIIEAGIQLLTSLVEALPEIISAIVAAIPQIIDGIVTAVLNSIPQIIDAGVRLLVSLIQNLPTIITTILQAIPQIISSLVNAIINSIPQIIQAGVQLFVSLIQNLPTIIVEIVKAVPQIIAGIVNAFTSSMGQIVNVGKNIVQGLWSGIQSLAGWIWDKVSGWISGIWDGICSFFGINSPSKEMAWVGEMLVKGLAGSIEDNGGQAVNAAKAMSKDIDGVMNELAEGMQTALPTDFSVGSNFGKAAASAMAGATGTSGFAIVLNITNFNNYGVEDIRQLTNEVMETASQFAMRKGVVFA